MPTSPALSTACAIPDLAAMRQSKGITLDQISSTTRISTVYLDAIERSEFGKLPGGVYDTSYIRQYARALGYDEWDLLTYYRAATRRPEAEEPEPPESRWDRLSRLALPIRRWLAFAKKV